MIGTGKEMYINTDENVTCQGCPWNTTCFSSINVRPESVFSRRVGDQFHKEPRNFFLRTFNEDKVFIDELNKRFLRRDKDNLYGLMDEFLR